ncbi:unnamed protein product [Allacma fusca]|uniref:Uncharacterized protein n=1 Tax=Allacma fusca TaxID=39272 RepID=A0A8J2PFN4_9HEXA|nr:unnamed protein product [Allacma fusca]
MSSNSTPVTSQLSESFLSRSPSKACFQSYFSHLKSKENSTLLHQQLRHLLDWNDRALEDLDQNRGQALDKHIIKMLFKISDLLEVPDLTKIHGIEIYDKWALAYDIELKSLEPYLSTSEMELLEKKFKDDLLLQIGTCILLASKSLFSEDLYNLLKRMNPEYELKDVNSSELKVLSALNFNLNCLTPLEIADVILMLLNLGEEDYRYLYGVCIRVIDFVYLMKKQVYAAVKDKMNSQNTTTVTQVKMTVSKLENDYVLRAAAAIQCATFITSPENPWIYLDSLVDLTRKPEKDIRNVSNSIGAFLLIVE